MTCKQHLRPISTKPENVENISIPFILLLLARRSTQKKPVKCIFLKQSKITRAIDRYLYLENVSLFQTAVCDDSCI